MTEPQLCPQCGYRTLPEKKKICDACNIRIWRAANPRKAAYFNLKRSAQKRGELFNLSFEDFWKIIKFTKYLQRKGRGSDDLQIDRIREDQGYTKDNIQVIKTSKNKEKFHHWAKHESITAKHFEQLMEDVPF